MRGPLNRGPLKIPMNTALQRNVPKAPLSRPREDSGAKSHDLSKAPGMIRSRTI